MNFPSIRIEGQIFSGELLQRLDQQDMTGQRPADFGLPSDVKVKDEIARAWADAQDYWRIFQRKLESQKLASTATTETRQQWIVPLLGLLGYQLEYQSRGAELNGKLYAISHRDINRAQTPVHIVGYRDSSGLDRKPENATLRMSPHAMVQEYLNLHDQLYGIVTNGATLRLLRDSFRLVRLNYLEFDLERMFTDGLFADFAVFYRLLHATRLPLSNDVTNASIIELYHQDSIEQGTRIREGLREAVTQALEIFGTGFVSNPDNHAFLDQLASGNVVPTDFFENLLRLIYRLLFLNVVEERSLVFPEGTSAKHINTYYTHYSVQRLRKLSRSRGMRNDRCHDAWMSLQSTFKIFERPEVAAKLGTTAFGGSLFDSQGLGYLPSCQLDNSCFFRALDCLCSFNDPTTGQRQPINFGALATEEFGSVYESLLELHPIVEITPVARFGFSQAAGNDRKTSGSYYTPSSLVNCLLDSALDPVLEDRIHDYKKLGYATVDAAILSLKVCDPACGSGHFLIAAAQRIARRLAVIRSNGEEPAPSHMRHALREVIGDCIYGVDINPMSVELCRVALWLEAVEPGKPLSFLNHHLVCGNALLGITDLKQLNAGIPMDAFKALSGDDKTVCKALAATNRAALKGRDQSGQGELFAINADEFRVRLAALDAMPSDSLDEVAAKGTAYEKVLHTAHESGVACAADLFVGAFLLSKQPGQPVPTSATLFDALESTRNDIQFEAARNAARAACETARVLHWPLVFAQVFANGGFDCMLGNPPWDMLQLDPQEWFSSRAPQVANAKNMAARDRELAKLQIDNPNLYKQYNWKLQVTEALQGFAHGSNRFRYANVGRLNLAPLFTETVLQILSDRGRGGMIVPTGVATDSFTQTLFNHISDGHLISLLDFENKEGIFPSVHRMYKFCLLTLGCSNVASFAFFMTNTGHLLDSRRRFTLSPDEFRLLNPNTMTCPVFRSQHDAELTKKIYRRVPVLMREDVDVGNPWNIEFMLMFMMNTDSYIFKDSPASNTLPLYEAKMIHQFDHRWATYETNGGDDEATCRNVAVLEKRSADYAVRPRYWVRQREVLARLADVPAALAKAYVGEAEQALRKAVANWLTLTSVDQHPLAKPKDIVEMMAGKTFVDGLTEEWLDEKFKAGTCAPLNEEELTLICDSRDLLETFNTIMDRRSPRWLMGWRDVTNATNERTVIASVIARAAVGNKVPLICFPPNVEGREAACLLCNLDCLVLDFVARQKIGGITLNFFYIRQFPILAPSSYSELDVSYIVPRVLELTYTSHELKPWAEDLGYTGEPFMFDEKRRAVLRAELDAYYAKLYGLNEEELRYILDPADVAGADYPSETFRVLKDREMREYGEYRTQRLVLTAWKELEGGNRQRSTRAYIDRRLYCRKLVLSMLAQSENKLHLDQLLSAWVALCDVNGLVQILDGRVDIKSWAALWPDRLTNNDSLQATLWDLLDRQAIRVSKFHVVERCLDDGSEGNEDIQMDAHFALEAANVYATHTPQTRSIRIQEYFDAGFLTRIKEGAYATA